MGKRISVLEIMDGARRDLQIAHEFKGMPVEQMAFRLMDARTVVAELIQAASEQQSGSFCCQCDKCRRLRKVLSLIASQDQDGGKA